MSVVPFDTPKLADRLQAGGFTSEQARTLASSRADSVSGAELATRTDLSETERAIRRDMDEVAAAAKRDLVGVAAAAKRDLIEMEQRLTVRLGSMLVVAVGVLLAAIRYLPRH